MRLSFVPALVFAAFVLAAFAATDRAEAVTAMGRQAIAPPQDGQLEEVASRQKRVAKRRVYRRSYDKRRRPYYAPYACSRPYKYYYWQFWPPVCYPL